ncbi:hypothetical protein [Uliginosibacterium gangwonense]|uniref:hypothetical protein n=1 Tax=Uliginosibacterium gangwonense TaxID=392736 RepID=UPI00036AAC8F|nr:hypothetical protein [Uliginosibacterium gangwonense]
MSTQRYTDVVTELCHELSIPAVDHVLKTRAIVVEGFDVILENYDDDPDTMYVHFQYGIVTGGRTLTVFRLMLEANITIYAQDQAQMGVDEGTGGIILLARVDLNDDIDGSWLADLLAHYSEHGRYWRDNILQTTDEMFEQLAQGSFLWIRA